MRDQRWLLAVVADEPLLFLLEDVFNAGGALMIEWPERVEAWLPDDRLWIAMRHLTETRRGMRLTAHGPRSLELLKQFRRSAFGV